MRSWRLENDEKHLAILQVIDVDQPWWICSVHVLAESEMVSIEQKIRAADAAMLQGDFKTATDLLADARMNGLRLHSFDDNEVVTSFLMWFDDGFVRLRC